MWSELAAGWRICLEEAWAAFGAGSIPIGACITDPDGAVVARGRNRTRDENSDVRVIHRHALAHAEMNALLVVDATHDLRDGFTLWTTTEPCPLCLGALYMGDIRNLRYAARDPWAGSVDLLGKTPYLSRKPIRAPAPTDSALETLSAALHVAFSLGEKHTIGGPFLTSWAAVLPDAVALGDRLHAANRLSKLFAAGASAAEMVDTVAAEIPPR